MGKKAARNDRTVEVLERAISRRHGMDTAPFRHIFRHANMVASVAAYVSVRHDMRGAWGVSGMIYHHVNGHGARSDIVQTAIRRGVAAARHVDAPEDSPVFRKSVITIKTGQWTMNEVAGGYVIHAGIGTRERPCHIAFGVPKHVGDLVSQHDVGELSITPETYSITYSKAVPISRTQPVRDRASVLELTTNIPYLQDGVEPILAGDLNAGSAMFSDGHVMAKFDYAKEVDGVLEARMSETPADKWRTMKDDIRYERRHGHPKTDHTVQAKRENQKIKHGGQRLFNKLGRQLRNLELEMGLELKAISNMQRAETRRINRMPVGTDSYKKRKISENKSYHDGLRAAIRDRYAEQERCLAARRAKCVLDGPKKKGKRVNNRKRQERVSKAARSLDHTLHAAACGIVAWALLTGSTITLEDLNGMSRGWRKMNKRTRTKLHAASIMKLHGYVVQRARWFGVEVILIHPRNTSALCSACGTKLIGDYHTRTCVHCHIRVDRDVNAVHNVRWTTIAARYGRRVRPSPDDARSAPSAILDPGEIKRGGVSLRVYGELAGCG